jgi:hypothetical protein
MANIPSTEQIEALKAYAREHGRTWKSQLLADWERARTVGPLQALRNSHGPSWLVRYRLVEG